MTLKLLSSALLLLFCTHSVVSGVKIQSLDEGEEGGRLTDTTEILRRMQEYNRRRKESIQRYTNQRSYHVEYEGIVDKKADLTAEVAYSSQNGKSFKVKSESGSELMRNRVIRKALESEVEAGQPSIRQGAAINPDNYEFNLLLEEYQRDDDSYIFWATPRKKTKFLFIGRVWVDSRDFAITRIEGKPAVNPSWWIRQSKIVQTYRKVGRFWFPDTNESTSGIRIFGGKAVLRIRYEEYEIEYIPLFPNMEKVGLLKEFEFRNQILIPVKESLRP